MSKENRPKPISVSVCGGKTDGSQICAVVVQIIFVTRLSGQQCTYTYVSVCLSSTPGRARALVELFPECKTQHRGKGR